ncbi:phage virion morphogenesis protein [Yersinia ruckeri]|uniref:phage virion morphogenesis protein n=1 Tax=Yersinia ruckeri TaxID=29486 RepID=UPI0020BE5DCC|nr:phage virion morphogenesis protein [Yersinia ruckeri]EKN4181791.1 phage virion morphogenesis protein [Yersinia ruckeri]MCK8554479.1 phage virion morphogenesis protein [Yersinia ruckeri]MCK8585531.1 phage virion morphogenesis protein [Yersinia ruckeri]UZX55822.1 phage virion morphogenesis protein [Yersinia ruckeri]UZY11915.1 phage virion morphogenesis protein [Yersinia ruckeri]
MIVSGELSAKQLAELKEALSGLELPAKKRQRLLWRIAKYGVMVAAKRHVRNQQAPDGTPWEGRKTRRRGKMLRNMPKLLHIREMPEAEAVRLYLQGGSYRNGEKPVPAGVVGYGQQNGMNVSINRRAVTKTSDPERKATIKQAKRLRALGYKVKKGKGWRKPPYKDIAGIMRFDQAGLLIRELSGKAAKTAWTVDVPARPFLGMSDDDFNKALARQLQAIGFG